MEGLNEQEIQQSLFNERVLPDLGSNIKCGNSLIGTDFYTSTPLDNARGKPRQLPLIRGAKSELSEEDIYKINAFDWANEFAEVFRDGGFDVVIGNPPYVSLISEKTQEYFQNTYKHQDYQNDLYLIFLEKYAALLKQGGDFGVIVSNTWLLSLTYRKIRRYLTANYTWRKILYLPDKVFSEAVVDTHVLVFTKKAPNDKDYFAVDIYKDKEVALLHKIQFANIAKDGLPINVIVNPNSRIIFDKIVKKCKQLKDYCNVYNGVKPFEKGKGTPPQSESIAKEKPYVFEGKKPNKDWLPLLRGSLIHKYINRWNNNYWIKYGEWLAAPRDPAIFEAPNKIVVRQTGDALIATYIEDGIICRNNLHIIINNSNLNLLFFLGLINSKLLNFCYEIINPEKGEALAEVKKNHVEQLPISIVDLTKKTDKDKHDNLVSLVDKMLELKKKEQTETTPQSKIIVQRQIEATDKEIDRAVYGLYGVGEDEIKIIEGSFGNGK
jgi:hypothetical protein